VVYGVLAHSLSLVADAGHNLGDVAGLILAWVAGSLGRRLPTARHTYGLRRSSVLAALANAVILLIAIGAIGWEAIGRLAHPEAVASSTVIVVAAIGIVVNGITALLFLAGLAHDLNIRAAFQHMLSDALISLGVVLAGVAMMATGWLWLDPVVSLVIAVLILWGTWGLFRDSLNLALDAVPEGLDAGAVRTYLTGLPDVAAVHDLHIWGMSTTETALTAHIVIPIIANHDALQARIAQDLQGRFGIGHATIQIESGDPAHPCRLEPDEVV
jgi:cobalt-zinc-cadmium efflux system protein